MSEAGDHVRVCPRSSSDAPSRSRALFFHKMSPALSGAAAAWVRGGQTSRAAEPGTRARAEKKPKCKPGSDYSEFSGLASLVPVCSGLSSELGTDSLHNTVLKISPRRAELGVWAGYWIWASSQLSQLTSENRIESPGIRLEPTETCCCFSEVSDSCQQQQQHHHQHLLTSQVWWTSDLREPVVVTCEWWVHIVMVI